MGFLKKRKSQWIDSAWLDSFIPDATHPCGVWRRIPETTPLTADADWQVVFDLDAFCRETQDDWHWKGANTLWSDPDRVLLEFS